MDVNIQNIVDEWKTSFITEACMWLMNGLTKKKIKYSYTSEWWMNAGLKLVIIKISIDLWFQVFKVIIIGLQSHLSCAPLNSSLF